MSDQKSLADGELLNQQTVGDQQTPDKQPVDAQPPNCQAVNSQSSIAIVEDCEIDLVPVSTRLSRGDATKIRRSKQTHDAIAEIINNIPRGVHLTAPEVYRRVRELGIEISLSTVYRTLNMLQVDGNVSTVFGDHGKRYESRHSDNDHDHLICLKCGLTIEFTDALIAGFGKLVAERKGYEHSSSRFDILGICSECKSKDEDHKIALSITALDNSLALISDCVPKIQSCIGLLESRKLARALELLLLSLPGLRDASAELEASVSYLSQQNKPGT